MLSACAFYGNRTINLGFFSTMLCHLTHWKTVYCDELVGAMTECVTIYFSKLKFTQNVSDNYFMMLAGIKNTAINRIFCVMIAYKKVSKLIGLCNIMSCSWSVI